MPASARGGRCPTGSSVGPPCSRAAVLFVRWPQAYPAELPPRKSPGTNSGFIRSTSWPFCRRAWRATIRSGPHRSLGLQPSESTLRPLTGPIRSHPILKRAAPRLRACCLTRARFCRPTGPRGGYRRRELPSRRRQRLGVDYANSRAVNPRVAYCSISGFGQTGPYRDRPADDIVSLAIGGSMSLAGNSNREAFSHLDQPVWQRLKF